MRRKRLLWQLWPSIFFTSVLMLVAATWYSSRSVRQFYLDQTAVGLESRARLLTSEIAARVGEEDFAGVDSLCKSLGPPSDTRITVILPSGVVIGDSDENLAEMQDHSDRPEFVEAMSGRVGRAIRYSTTAGHRMMCVAAPVATDVRIGTVVRVAVPLRSVELALGKIGGQIVAGVLVLALAAALVGLLVSRRIARPIERLAAGAERFSEGDFRAPLPASDSGGDRRSGDRIQQDGRAAR